MSEAVVGARAEQFSVHLENFSGPFDLLLGLISRHKLDVTEIALAAVTDEFIAHIRAQGTNWDLEQTSQFLVVAATLLDLKTARLLPQGEVEDPEDLALLEARDLLFARLLQYRAFKAVAAWIDATLATEGQHFVRPGGLEPEFSRLLPDVVFDLTLRQKSCRLEVEQGRRDDEELARLLEVPVRPLGPDVGDELVGDHRERDLGDVELVTRDQAQEQIERT